MRFVIEDMYGTRGEICGCAEARRCMRNSARIRRETTSLIPTAPKTAGIRIPASKITLGSDPNPGTIPGPAGPLCPLLHSKQDSRTRQEKQDPHRGARERQRRPKHKPVGGKMNCEMHEALKAPEHNQRLIKMPSQGRIASEAEAAWLQRTSACRRTVKVSS